MTRAEPPGRRDSRLVRVADLLQLEEFAGATLLGGQAGLQHPVDGVEVVSTAAAPALTPRRLIVAALRNRPPFEIEVLLRQAHDAGSAAVLLLELKGALVSTRRLADRLALPTFALAGPDPLALAWRLSQLIDDPALRGWDLLLNGLAEIERAPDEPTELLAAATRALGGSVAVLAADGTPLFGSELTVEPGELAGTEARTVPLDGARGFLVPVAVEPGGPPDLWLVHRGEHGHPDWERAADRVLRGLGARVAVWATRERMAGERNARERADVLAELLQSAEFGPALIERAILAGLRVDGWHVAMYLRVVGPSGPAGAQLPRRTIRQLEAELAAVTGAGPLVERPDGWVTWVTTRADPGKTSYRPLTERVRAVVEAFGPVVGIGRPYEGPRGIGQSVVEARDAVLFAGYERRRGPVEHADELGVRRALSEWYRAEGFRRYAEQILAPLLDSQDEQLLRTLGAYLDNESSTSATAARLHVHRNTVTQRIARAESLLSVNLTRPDDRLVVQLACRVLGLTGDPQPD